MDETSRLPVPDRLRQHALPRRYRTYLRSSRSFGDGVHHGRFLDQCLHLQVPASLRLRWTSREWRSNVERVSRFAFVPSGSFSLRVD